MVRSEMEGADVGPVQFGTDDPLDLFQDDEGNEGSDGAQNRRSRTRSEADLCDSNFVHVGAVREQECHLSASQSRSIGSCQLKHHT